MVGSVLKIGRFSPAAWQIEGRPTYYRGESGQHAGCGCAQGLDREAFLLQGHLRTLFRVFSESELLGIPDLAPEREARVKMLVSIRRKMLRGIRPVFGVHPQRMNNGLCPRCRVTSASDSWQRLCGAEAS